MILRLETATGEALVIDRDRITSGDVRPDRVIHVGDGKFHPGLINAHDHLHRNHYPRMGFPPYEDAYAWGEDIHKRCADQIATAKTLDQPKTLLFGAFKNIIAGVTTVVHHDAWELLFDQEFPIRVAGVRTLHSLGLDRDRASALANAPRVNDGPLCIHLAEGTNQRAAHEVAELAALGLLDGRLLAVHGVGIDAQGSAQMRMAGVGFVWCPTSNCFLFHKTAPRALLESGIDVLLGTDALLTGAGTLLDELRVARAFGWLSDDKLLAAVGSVAARRLGLEAPTLAPGARADVIVMVAPVLEARPADVALVLVGGRTVLANSSIEGLPMDDADTIDVGGVTKRMPRALVDAARQVVGLTAECGRILK